jgi:hypothetical protein
MSEFSAHGETTTTWTLHRFFTVLTTSTSVRSPTCLMADPDGVDDEREPAHVSVTLTLSILTSVFATESRFFCSRRRRIRRPWQEPRKKWWWWGRESGEEMSLRWIWAPCR